MVENPCNCNCIHSAHHILIHTKLQTALFSKSNTAFCLKLYPKDKGEQIRKICLQN